jgi:hypothetical protein
MSYFGEEYTQVPLQCDSTNVKTGASEDLAVMSD